jgi:hypothetical protein
MRSIREIIVDNLPFESRAEMIVTVRFAWQRERYGERADVTNADPANHSILDAFRRLKMVETVEEWCEGTITLAGHVPTND